MMWDTKNSYFTKYVHDDHNKLSVLKDLLTRNGIVTVTYQIFGSLGHSVTKRAEF